jgi:hypothetical protein
MHIPAGQACVSPRVHHDSHVAILDEAEIMAAHRSMIGLEELVNHFGPDVIAIADRISGRLRGLASHAPHPAGRLTLIRHESSL